MDKNEIIKMARQAELIAHDEDGNEFFFLMEELEDFAKLVAKAKAEQLATALELGPVNDTAASIAIWIRQQ